MTSTYEWGTGHILFCLNLGIEAVVDIISMIKDGKKFMVLKFSDIDNTALYKKSRVIVVTGQHKIFNRMLVDRVRNSTKGDVSTDTKSSELMSEFFGEEEEEVNDISSGSIDLDTFFKVVNTPSLTGKWYCCSEYKFISKKNKDKIKNYIKKPNENGILVIVASEWNDIKELRRLQSLKSSQFSHIIDLSYPQKKQLESIVVKLFSEKNKNVCEEAVKLFVMRMSTAYDDYDDTIQAVCENLSDKKDISYVEMKEAMHGIENFIMDDFLKALLKQMNSVKVVKGRKIYKILDSLMNELTARDVVIKLKYKIRDMIEYRGYINDGSIPVKGRYNVEKIKTRIPEESKVYKASSIVFKRNAYMSSMTSIGDWVYMYNILDKIRVGATENEYFHAIIALMHRRIISNDRLMNEICVKNTLDESLIDVNKLFCTDGWQSLRRVTDADEHAINAVDNKAVNVSTGEIVMDLIK